MDIKQQQDFFQSKSHAFCLFLLNDQDMADIHGHEFDELVIVRSGSGFHMMNNQVQMISQGDFLFISANDIHYYESTNNLSLINILLRKERNFNFIHNIDELINEIRLHTMPLAKQCISLADDELKKIIALADEISAKRDDDFDIVYFSATESMVLQIISLICYGISYKKNSHRSTGSGKQMVLNYVRQNYKQNINWDSLCEECGIAKRTMFRFFNEIAGVTPEKFQLLCKLFKAQELLRTTDISVKEIALICGFTNTPRLTESYKKKFLRTPSQERHLSL